MIQCFNRQGEPLGIMECAELMHDPSAKRRLHLPSLPKLRLPRLAPTP